MNLYAAVLVPETSWLRPAPERLVHYLDSLLDLQRVGKRVRVFLRDYGSPGFVGRNPKTGAIIQSPALVELGRSVTLSLRAKVAPSSTS